MYKRYERTRDATHPNTEKMLSLAQLWQWIDSATEVRNAYLRGELSEENALAIIRAEP